MPKILAFGGAGLASGGTINGNLVITGTLDVTGVATFTTTVTGSGNIMAGAAFAVGFTGRAQFKSPADGQIEVYATNGSTRGRLSVATGGAASPGITFGAFGAGEEGIGSPANDQVALVAAGTDIMGIAYDGTQYATRLRSVGYLSWSSTNAWPGTADTSVFRVSAGVVGFGAGGGVSGGGIGGSQPAQSANGANIQILSLSELTTIAAAATTDTTIQIPANSIACVVTGRVTVVIPTAATFDVGIAGATTRYATGIAVAANTTFPGSLDGWRYYAAATSIRITPNLTPADNSGRLRVTIFYMTPTAPTS